MGSRNNRIDVNPGPLNPVVLNKQESHRSTNVWAGEDVGNLNVRRNAGGVMKNRALHARVIHYIRHTCLYGLRHIAHIKIDTALITALVERWRVETHTFHLPCGEATVTLQDVAVLLGLPILGPPITPRGQSADERTRLCMETWGMAPNADHCKGSLLKVSFFDEVTASYNLDTATDEQIRAYGTAWMLQMVASVLFADKSSGYIKTTYLPYVQDIDVVNTYNWGSSVLAVLYRELCKATSIKTTSIVGPLILLQLWAWERLAHISPIARNEYAQSIMDQYGQFIPVEERPPLGIRWTPTLTFGSSPAHVLTYYRDQLDLMQDYEMVWEPYSENLLHILPPICTNGRHIWMAKVHLIHNGIVEWHLPDRVVRQFSGIQTVPHNFDTCADLHKHTDTGKAGTQWAIAHAQYMTYWANAGDHVVPFMVASDPPECDPAYMEWYRIITRRVIGRRLQGRQKTGAKPIASLVKKMSRALGNIRKMMSVERQNFPLAESAYQEACQALEEEEEWVDEDPSNADLISGGDSDDEVPTYVRKRGRVDKGKGKDVGSSRQVDVDRANSDTDSDDRDQERMQFPQGTSSSTQPLQRGRWFNDSDSYIPQFEQSDENAHIAEIDQSQTWIASHLAATHSVQDPYVEPSTSPGFQQFAHYTNPFQSIQSTHSPPTSTAMVTPAQLIRKNPNRVKKGKNKCATGSHFDRVHK